jgi:dipeptidyl-peptidase-4
VDADRRVAIVQGSDDPKTNHLWELPLDGGPPRALTSGRGEHVGSFARRSRAYAVTSQSLESPPVVNVFRADGAPAGVLPSDSVPVPAPPNVEFLRVAGLEAALVRPRDFTAGRKYPVLVWIYGGPSEGEVRDALGASEFVRLQAAADRGYLVFTADNRGLANRGRAFERAIRGDFATLLLEDQVGALREAAGRIPEMDLSRVGIYGWSFGGYAAALAVAARGDVFHAAVAGAPVVDWLDYDTHYTERYLGLPDVDPEAYRRSSVLTYASKLERPLLIVHGTADDNVYFLHSLRLADALFRLGRKAELVPVANTTHLVRRDPEAALALERRTAAFFDEHVRDRR